jgi:hypothetical protein
MFIRENFLSDDECDSIVQFYKDNVGKAYPYRNTFPLRLHQFPQFAPLLTSTALLSKIESEIFTNFSSEMRLDNFEIVRWPVASYMDYHFDGNDKCGFFCYLNDDFLGGETVVVDTVVTPQKGKMLYFENAKLIHKVNPVGGSDRFTLAGWYV